MDIEIPVFASLVLVAPIICVNRDFARERDEGFPNIRRLVKEGYSYAEIGRHFNRSRERIRQVVSKYELG